MPVLEKTMFREYDIRGHESEDELNEQSVYHIARGFGRMLRDHGVNSVIVGNDARTTSECFSAQAKKALMESGVSIIDIGTVTTPMSYWAQYYFDVNGLCMITASHNPVGWNGLKLGAAKSRTLGSEEIQQLYDIIAREAYSSAPEYPSVRRRNVSHAYIADLATRAPARKPLRVLINAGNGTAGMYAPAVFRKAGYQVIEHLTNVDPTYPNYTANPDGEVMMADTGEQVLRHGADIGLAFDGDGDRLGVVDERGETIWPDRYAMLLSRSVLATVPGAKIVFDVKVSEALPEDISAHGGVPIMWKTGHSHIKAKLHEEQAALAGEMSGHIFFREGYYGFDDACYAGLKLLEYCSLQQKTISELIATTPYYVATPTIQVETTDESKYAIVDKLTECFKQDGYRVVDINGARVYMIDADGNTCWGLVRASSNVPKLVLRFEAKTDRGLHDIQNVFKEKLSQHGVDMHWDTSGN